MDYQSQLESFLRHSPPRSFWSYWRKTLLWIAAVLFGIILLIAINSPENLVNQESLGELWFAATATTSEWVELIVFWGGPYLVTVAGMLAIPVALVLSQRKRRKSEANSASQSFWHSSPQDFWRYWWGAFPWVMGIEMIFRSTGDSGSGGQGVTWLRTSEWSVIERIFDAAFTLFLPLLQISIIAALTAFFIAWVMRQRALWKTGTDSSEPAATNPEKD